MNLFAKLAGPDINRLAKEAEADPSIALIDVRTDEEYEAGHIPGSIHLELAKAEQLPGLLPDKSRPLYVYCHSGMRSAQACRIFQALGYETVKNIGGIAAWNGALSRE